MSQHRQYPRSALETRHARGIIGKGLGQEFHCNLPIEVSVTGAVDFAHARRTFESP